MQPFQPRKPPPAPVGLLLKIACVGIAFWTTVFVLFDKFGPSEKPKSTTTAQSIQDASRTPQATAEIDDASIVQSTPTPQPIPQANAATPQAPTPAMEGLIPHDGFDVESHIREIAYSVKTPVQTPRLSGADGNLQARDGTVFVIVFFMERNDGTKTIKTFEPPLTLIDSRNRTFEWDLRATSVLESSDIELDLADAELHPGVARHTVAVFQVPKSVAENTLTIVVNDRLCDGCNPLRLNVKPGSIHAWNGTVEWSLPANQHGG